MNAKFKRQKELNATATLIQTTTTEARSIGEKHRIVEETLAAGAPVAPVARTHGINADHVFGWRRLYLAGRLGEPKSGMKLLSVRVSESKSALVIVARCVTDFSQPQAGTIHIELLQAQMRIEGNVDPSLVRVLLECLRG